MALVRNKAEVERHVSANVVRATWKAFRAAVFARRVEN